MTWARTPANGLSLVAVALMAGCHVFGLEPTACVDDDNCPFAAVCLEGVCVAPGTPGVDGGPLDAGLTDDAGLDGGDDAGLDSGVFDAGNDAGVDGGSVDGGNDGGVDGGPIDAGSDAGVDAGLDSGVIDAGVDAGLDSGVVDGGPVDGGNDAGVDGGLIGGPEDFLAYWRLNGNAVEETGDHPSNLEGRVRFGPGVDGLAAHFNGEGVLNGGLFPEFSSGDEATITAWVRDDAPWVFKTIAGFGDAISTDLQMGTEGNRLYLDVSELDDNYVFFDDYTIDVAPGKWHHIAVTYNGQRPPLNRGNIYVDGIARAINNASPLPAAHGDLSPIPFQISRWENEHPWFGMIDDVRLFNRALDRAEIVAIANTFSPPIPQDYIFYVPFDGLGHDVTKPNDGGDVIGEDVGAIVGPVVGAASVPFITAGIYGPEPALAGIPSMTVAVWVRLYSAGASRGLLSMGAPGAAIAWTIDADDSVRFQIGTTEARLENAVGTVIAPSTWVHMAVVYNGLAAPGSRIRFYFGGEFHAANVDTLAAQTPNDLNPANVVLGNFKTDFAADLDEYMIYPRALSPEEIAQLVLLGTP